MKKVLILNGPNLNMLGKRPKEHYGSKTLQDIENLLLNQNQGMFALEFYQSNYEGDLVTKIQNSLDYFAILLNPGAYTHTSIAIRDALEIFSGFKIEVHLSSVDEREAFRQMNFIRDICHKTFSGKQEQSYLEALQYLKNLV